MLNKIIDGVSVALDAAFEGITMYSEGVKQDFQEPCFFILSLNPSQTQIVGPRYRREYPFDIHYFPRESQEKNQEMNSTAENLLQVLEYITVDGNLIRGTRMNYEKVDGVLHFFISYNLHVHKDIQKQDPMDEVAVTSGLKE